MTKKPYPEFPLTPHPRGSWVKKINGKMHYFGRISAGWKPALEKYKREIDDLKTGRTPPPDPGSLTVEELCNEYLAAGKARVQSGELQSDSWLDAQRSGKIMVADLCGSAKGSHLPGEQDQLGQHARRILSLLQSQCFMLRERKTGDSAGSERPPQ